MSDDLHSTMDAVVWAKEFCKRWPSALCEIEGREGVRTGADFEDTMIGWFANAIMVGYDTANNRAADRIEELLATNEYLNSRLENVLSREAETYAEHKEQLEAARADAKEAEAYADELEKDQVDLCRQLIAAEDKLAKAMELVTFASNMDVTDWSEALDVKDQARTTLAEIEGEK
jgi:hypothetical protein